jgi:choline-sulfatase
MGPRPRLGVVALLIAGLAGCDTGAPTIRNAVLVSVDTLRADVLGPYGGPIPTPGFDALARQGVVVEGACTPTPSTGPAHASLLTGLHPWHHGILRNAWKLPEELPHLAAIAREGGLQTAAFVSSFVVDARFGFARGFDAYHFEPSQRRPYHGEVIGFWAPGEETTEAALDWLGEHGSEPFLLWIHYFDPHSPYDGKRGYRSPEPVDLEGKTLPKDVKSWNHLAGLIEAYRGEVDTVDTQIKRLLRGLRALDLLDTTVLMVTSDHGEGLGDHGWLGHGRNLHDELVVVPLLVRAPGLEGGRRLRGPAQLEDLMPTLLAMLGLPAPDGIDGVDLSPWLRGEVGASPRDAVVGRRADYPEIPALFYQRRWPEKWIGELDTTSGGRYRLDADPREAKASPARIPELLQARVPAAVPAGRQPALDAETRRALEALGYADGGGGVAE